jgi:hypothetical protein
MTDLITPRTPDRRIFPLAEPSDSLPRNPARRRQLIRQLPPEIRSRAPARPPIRPPCPDSQLKRLIRELVPVKVFDRLQESQRLGTEFQTLSVPEDVKERSKWDLALLVVTFVNEVREQIDGAAFFYEKFLDFIEFSLDAPDDPEVCPWEIVVGEQREYEREEVRLMIELADRMVLEGLGRVLGI